MRRCDQTFDCYCIYNNIFRYSVWYVPKVLLVVLTKWQERVQGHTVFILYEKLKTTDLSVKLPGDRYNIINEFDNYFYIFFNYITLFLLCKKFWKENEWRRVLLTIVWEHQNIFKRTNKCLLHADIPMESQTEWVCHCFQAKQSQVQGNEWTKPPNYLICSPELPSPTRSLQVNRF